MMLDHTLLPEGADSAGEEELAWRTEALLRSKGLQAVRSRLERLLDQ